MNHTKAQHALFAAIIALGLLNAFAIGATQFPKTVHEVRTVYNTRPVLFHASELLYPDEFLVFAAPLHQDDLVCWDTEVFGGNATFIVGDSRQRLSEAPVYEVGADFTGCIHVPFSGQWFVYLINWEPNVIAVNFRVSAWVYP